LALDKQAPVEAGEQLKGLLFVALSMGLLEEQHTIREDRVNSVALSCTYVKKSK